MIVIARGPRIGAGQRRPWLNSVSRYSLEAGIDRNKVVGAFELDAVAAITVTVHLILRRLQGLSRGVDAGASAICPICQFSALSP